MPQFTVSKQSAGQSYIRLIRVFPPGAWVQIQVFGPGTLYLAQSASELLGSPQGGVLPGLQFNAATGIKSMPWTGEMWATANVQNVMVTMMYQDPPSVIGSIDNPGDVAVADQTQPADTDDEVLALTVGRPAETKFTSGTAPIFGPNGVIATFFRTYTGLGG